MVELAECVADPSDTALLGEIAASSFVVGAEWAEVLRPNGNVVRSCVSGRWSMSFDAVDISRCAPKFGLLWSTGRLSGKVGSSPVKCTLLTRSSCATAGRISREALKGCIGEVVSATLVPVKDRVGGSLAMLIPA